MQNKRGQGLSTNAIILIVLGVVVLVVLIVGFTIGWGSIVPWIKTNNVDTIVQACETACSTNAKYDFCSSERELKDDAENKIKTTCNLFSNIEEYRTTYGIDKCSNICDKIPCTDIKVIVKGDKKKGIEKNPCAADEQDITAIATVTAGSFCCIAV